MPTYPVRLRGSPLYLVDLPLSGGVSQNWVLDSPRHLLDVPDQGLDMGDSVGMIDGPGIALKFTATFSLTRTPALSIPIYIG